MQFQNIIIIQWVMQYSTNRIISPILYLWDNDSDTNDDGDRDETSSSNTRDEYDADDICDECDVNSNSDYDLYSLSKKEVMLWYEFYIRLFID